MENVYINSCRLCLNIIISESFQIIEDVVKEILEVLRPNLNLDDSGVRVICDVCLKKLLAAFQFKSTCLYTEDKIFPYINDSKTLDLKEIYLKEKGVQQLVSISLNDKICRLCMEPVNHNFKSLRKMDFDMFQKFLPEMDLTVVEYPIVCKECQESFDIHTEFLKGCFSREEKLNFSEEKSVDKSIEMKKRKGTHEKSYHCEENTKRSFLFKYPRKSNKQTKRKQHLAMPQFVQKDLSGQMYKCGECKYETKYKGNLRDHQLKHKDSSEVQMYRCGECRFETKYKTCLKGHQLRHKNLSEVQRYRCNECDYKSIRKDHLQKHQLTHKDPSEVKMYKCGECKYESKLKENLKQHQLRHRDVSEVRMYKCGECKFETKHESYLKKHKLIHEDPSALYKCDECDYRSIHKNNLKQHQLIHKDPSELQMYRCNECDYKSIRKGQLVQHVLKHKDPSEEQMHKCSECTFETRHKRYLKVHLANHRKK